MSTVNINLNNLQCIPVFYLSVYVDVYISAKQSVNVVFCLLNIENKEK